MDEVEALAQSLSEEIEKIPHLKTKLNTSWEGHRVIRVTTVVRHGKRKYDRSYDVAIIEFGDLILVETYSSSSSSYPSKMRKRNGKLFGYADPKSIKMILEHILNLARTKINSLKGSYTSSVGFHRKQIEKEEIYIARSEIRIERTIEMQEHLKNFKLDGEENGQKGT